MKSELEQYKKFIKKAEILKPKDADGFLFKGVASEVILTQGKKINIYPPK